MNRPEQIEQLIQEAFPGDRPETGMDERILSDASSVMKQACAASAQTRTVLDWRQIMRSPITRAAAVIAVIASTIWAYYQSVDHPSGTPTVLSLLNAATATENAWFTGDQTVHIVNRIVISPQHDTNDLGKLFENLESNFDQENLDALQRGLLRPRGMEFFSLNPFGHRHQHHLELVDAQAGEATIEDCSWYDPMTGKYARMLIRNDRVLFGHSYDGYSVYLAQRDGQGELTIQSEPVTASFSAPKNIADFLGSTAASVQQLLEEKDMLIRGKPTESTLRDKSVLVYKLTYFDLADEGYPYAQLSVDKNDQSIAKVEFITDEKSALTIDCLSRTQGEFPPVGWDLSALPGSHETPAPDVAVRSEIGWDGLTIQEVAERATFPVFVFGKDPYGTLRRTVYEDIDPVSPPDRVYSIIYETQQNVAVGLLQCRTLDRFVKAETKNVDLQAIQALTTPNGFKFYGLDADGNASLLNVLFDRLNKTAAENRSIYLLISPDDQFMFLGVDGWLPHSELEQLTASLISAQDYKPTHESLPKPVVDLNVATHTELKHSDYITRWLMLGRFDYAYESDPNDVRTQKRALDDAHFDPNRFTPRIRVGDQEYAWTSCYAQSSGPGRVYGVSTPGICYGRTRINMPKPTRAALAIKSSDPVRVWLNGQLIHEALGIRYHYHVTKSVPVTFRSGENHLVYKTLRFTGNAWLFSCRFQAGSAALYEPSTEEQARGFIPVQGDGPEPRPRLKRLEVDLGRHECDLVPVKLVGLSESDTVSIRLSGPGASLCTPWIEKDYQLHAGTQAVLSSNHPARIWLEINSETHPPGVYELTVNLFSEQGNEVCIPGTVTVHDVALPEAQTMGTKYCVGLVELSGGFSTEPEAQKRLELLLDDLATLRTKICEFRYTWRPPNILPLVNIAGTNQTLQAAGQAGLIDINTLPDLDFSSFDPWIAGAAQRGMTHLHIGVRRIISDDARTFAKAVLGDDIVCSDEITWKVLMWLYSQFRDYAISRGMTETWADIGWELHPSEVAEYVQTASRFQTMGYRTYARKSGIVSQNAKWLNQMNAHCDVWHMNYYYIAQFLRFTQSTQGKAAVPLDEADQLWCNHYETNNTPYEEGRAKAWYTFATGAHGYSCYGRYWGGHAEEALVRYDQERQCIIHSPMWHGLRDGNEDAAYYHLLLQRLQGQGDQAGLARLTALTGKSEDAPLPDIKVSYDGQGVDRPIGFQQFNQAKRDVLKMLCTDQ
jgi:hypothetical protein